MSNINNENNWETDEVIRWLINDEDAYRSIVDMTAEQVRSFVVEEQGAPAGLYKTFAIPPASSFDDVDWQEVVNSL